MPTFTDANGREWSVKFDGLLLADLKHEFAINLADLGGADYLRIESDQSLAVQAICVLCRDQIKAAGITRQQFAASLFGDCLDSLTDALWGAAKVFFPAKRLSALQSNCNQRRAQMQAMAALGDLPESMRPAVTEALIQAMAESASQASKDKASATGSAATPANNASASPESAA